MRSGDRRMALLRSLAVAQGVRSISVVLMHVAIDHVTLMHVTFMHVTVFKRPGMTGNIKSTIHDDVIRSDGLVRVSFAYVLMCVDCLDSLLVTPT